MSEDTWKRLKTQPDIAFEYTAVEYKTLRIRSIDKTVKSYIIDRRETDSYDQSMVSSGQSGSQRDSGPSLGSKGTNKQLSNSSEVFRKKIGKFNVDSSAEEEVVGAASSRETREEQKHLLAKRKAGPTKNSIFGSKEEHLRDKDQGLIYQQIEMTAK